MADANTIGQKLVALCKEGKNDVAVQELYAKDIISVEAAEGPNMQREVRGIEAIRAKGESWEKNHEVHTAGVMGPFPHGEDRFAVMFDYDVTFIPENKRQQLQEVAVYTVNNGKIIREEFYYGM